MVKKKVSNKGMNKNLVIGIIVVVILLVGVFLYFNNQKEVGLMPGTGDEKKLIYEGRTYLCCESERIRYRPRGRLGGLRETYFVYGWELDKCSNPKISVPVDKCTGRMLPMDSNACPGYSTCDDCRNNNQNQGYCEGVCGCVVPIGDQGHAICCATTTFRTTFDGRQIGTRSTTWKESFECRGNNQEEVDFDQCVGFRPW